MASLPPFSVIRIQAFETRKYFDSLSVNGYKYSGSGLRGTSTVLWSNISWTSSGWNHLKQGMPKLPYVRGWRICVEKPPSCSDGLELVPVAIPDCPPSGEDLPNCNDAAPGELCEGDGRCGTRKDLNNCYGKFHTYPATRDVYQKETGSTRTSTTSTTTMTMTTTSVPSVSTVDWMRCCVGLHWVVRNHISLVLHTSFVPRQIISAKRARSRFCSLKPRTSPLV